MINKMINKVINKMTNKRNNKMMTRTPEMQKMMDTMFQERTKRVRENKCPVCAEPINYDSFKDALSRREYAISGTCQKCQDYLFGGDE